MEKLQNNVEKYYFHNNQVLNLSTVYEDDGKLTSQNVCLIEKGANHCIFCTRIRTYLDLNPSELGHKPYLIYDPNCHEFTVTIPTFTYLTKADLSNAIYYIVRENVWLVFNVKIDGWNIGEFTTKKRNFYTIDPDEIGMFVKFEKENQK
jgi:hypothetical protein